MNVDLTEFKRLHAPNKSLCGVFVALAELELRERDQLEAALSEDKYVISAGAIEKWCKRRSLDVSHQQVASHRNRTCTCYGRS